MANSLEAHRHSISTAHADLSYLDVGTGPTALFVHGVGTNASFWGDAIARLQGRRAVAFDWPLHGHSPARPGQDYSLGALADLIEELCDALDLHDVHLVAHDTGGALAQIFAARHPERLRSFTLTNCDTHDNVPPEAFKPTVELARAGALAPTAAALVADLDVARTAIYASGYENVEVLSLDMVRSFVEPIIGTPERAREFERFLAALEPTDLLAAEPALKRLTVPTLVVWGTADEFFDVKWALWLRDTIPGVTEVVELDGAKLFFPHERAAELAPHLERHWAAVEGAAVASA